MIKYIGSKRTLVPTIVEIVRRLGDVHSVVDLFSGTARVGHALKAAGYRVLANDYTAYAETLARCYIQADAEDVLDEARVLIRELNSIKGSPGYFTDTYCVKSRFFQPKNCERIDAIREAIATMDLNPELEAVLLVSLMEAADRVDSTTGVQMAYLKRWAPRSYNDLYLRVPAVLHRARHGKGLATRLDALEAARVLKADVAYVDPPYNQHSYLGNYHIWESLVLWDKPEVYGVACKRVDVRERKSVFNSKPKFAPALKSLLSSIQAKTVILSFNNEGYLTKENIEDMLNSIFSDLIIIENDYKRYVGAQIGIHNQRGEKVGKVSHLRNKEYLYIASHEKLPEHVRELSTAAPTQPKLF